MAAAAATHALRGGARARARAPQVFTKCGNQYPSSSGGDGGSGGGGVGGGRAAPVWAAPPREISAVNISSYGWVYVF
jgi:hypothetical protein